MCHYGSRFPVPLIPAPCARSEPYKSIECFRAATHGIKSEEFLMKLLQMAVEDPKHTEVIYYLKVRLTVTWLWSCRISNVKKSV